MISGLYSNSRGVAQLAAHRVWDAGVGGSSPPTPTVFLRSEWKFNLPKVKFDGVIDTVRYTPSGKMELVRVYEKRGPTFSDITLLTRDELLHKLQAGKKFFVGKRIPLQASTFEISVPVFLSGKPGLEIIVSGRQRGDNDDIQGAPLF
jgi:hypothetical protein